MLTHILETPNIDRDLEELILQKTEGIPFFIEGQGSAFIRGAFVVLKGFSHSPLGTTCT